MWGQSYETFEETAATIAHEIKNPLQLALANLDIIKISDTESRYGKNCAVIERELFKINQLVLDLIHLSRADEREEEFDVTGMLRDLFREYQNNYESIKFKGPRSGRCSFVGMRKKMLLVFSNLLNNAVEAVPDGGRIQADVIVEPYFIRVLIRDNGTGLDETKLGGSIFTTKANGTGVGLRYCRNTVAQHGGKFTIRNLDEGGCVATVELPRRCG
ncbi:MAG: HAMP domain-containing histidine kinase [Clostridiales bacterium]|jgi:two-component system sporulation sensor kinase A|nr:HAMP domain-containing histidine kinase [Clostridiales bacterium]